MLQCANIENETGLDGQRTGARKSTLVQRNLGYVFFCYDGQYNMDMTEAMDCAEFVGAIHSILYHMAPGESFDHEGERGIANVSSKLDALLQSPMDIVANEFQPFNGDFILSRNQRFPDAQKRQRSRNIGIE